ncbi:unnamed protein product [Albugo candida]|uniref:Uncharacterized protein n=2 Tax=Albugo candida TaxID=65357 RepID=A0A024G6L3_9STRA|nr:unnamed protein product [Albugo candida]|eukprot:CCI42501.1 unnamed protein product [Albugo candida]
MTQLTDGTHEPDQMDKVASCSRNEAKKSLSNRSETDHVSEQQSLMVRRVNKNQKKGKSAKICEASMVTNEKDASIAQAPQAKSTKNAVERQVRDFDVSQPEAEKDPDHSVFNVVKEQSDAKQTMNEETQSESRGSYITPGVRKMIWNAELQASSKALDTKKLTQIHDSASAVSKKKRNKRRRKHRVTEHAGLSSSASNGEENDSTAGNVAVGKQECLDAQSHAASNVKMNEDHRSGFQPECTGHCRSEMATNYDQESYLDDGNWLTYHNRHWRRRHTSDKSSEWALQKRDYQNRSTNYSQQFNASIPKKLKDEADRIIINAASTSSNGEEFAQKLHHLSMNMGSKMWDIAVGAEFIADICCWNDAYFVRRCDKFGLAVLFFRTFHHFIASVDQITREAMTTKQTKSTLLGGNMEGVMKQWILFNTIELKKKYKAPSCDVKMARKLKRNLTIEFGGDWHIFVSANRQLYCPSRHYSAGWLDFIIENSRIMIYTNGRADRDLEQGTWSCRRRMWVAAVGCTWIISFWSLRQLVYNSPHPRPIIGFCPKLAYEIIPRDICLANEPLIATKTAIQALLEAFIESWQMWILLLFFLVRKMLRC